MSHIDLDKFIAIKAATEIEYKKIISIRCPALGSEISFNSDGWHHLSYDYSRKERSKKVQKNKFIYFSKAVDILRKSTTIQEYRRSLIPFGKPDKNGLRRTEFAHYFGFYSIVSFTKKTRIMVVVRRIGERGQCHFWSVMPYWRLSNNQRVIGNKDIEDK